MIEGGLINHKARSARTFVLAPYSLLKLREGETNETQMGEYDEINGTMFEETMGVMLQLALDRKQNRLVNDNLWHIHGGSCCPKSLVSLAPLPICLASCTDLRKKVAYVNQELGKHAVRVFNLIRIFFFLRGMAGRRMPSSLHVYGSRRTLDARITVTISRLILLNLLANKKKKFNRPF